MRFYEPRLRNYLVFLYYSVLALRTFFSRFRAQVCGIWMLGVHVWSMSLEIRWLINVSRITSWLENLIKITSFAIVLFMALSGRTKFSQFSLIHFFKIKIPSNRRLFKMSRSRLESIIIQNIQQFESHG